MLKRFCFVFYAASLVMVGCAQADAAARLRAGGLAVVQGVGDDLDDGVVRAILPGNRLPRTVFEIRERLLGRGGRLDTHIVANRGHENPGLGSFSIFESYTGPMDGGFIKEGELFIGFFTERRGRHVAIQQSFAPGLMVELIAWDYTKRRYNFWELVGTGSDSVWKYRGDSADIQADVARINLGETGAAFGSRLRCSGCHTQGGPIMKELAAPHNDWWRESQPLDLGLLTLADGPAVDEHTRTAAGVFRRARDAGSLAKLVRTGTKRMLSERAQAAGTARTLRERLRSLFTTMEMNLASDTAPFVDRISGRAPAAVHLPAGFFVDERLSGAQRGPVVPLGVYSAGLEMAGSGFGHEDGRRLQETRHAFLVPIRSDVDQAQLDMLAARGLVDDELITDVLAVDLTTPVYSADRSALIRHVPEQATSVHQLRTAMIQSLAKDSSPAGRELLLNLTDPGRTANFHRQRARAFLARCRKRQDTRVAVTDWLQIASQRRREIAAAPVSQNPRGTILEPGFRVIFPQDRLNAQPGQWRLRESDCGCEKI